jgi:Uma2 family endonuclease
MEAVTILPRSRPLVREDLDTMPDDGHRYELLDGMLIVTPAPRHLHQRAVTQLWRRLDDSAPADLEVLVAPFEVVLAIDTVLQPDVLVARREDFTDRDLPAVPVLAVEVLSPSTRLFDLNTKKARYEQAGVPSYWVIDPDKEAPSVTVWELRDAAFVEVARASAAETLTVRLPFPLTLVPADLVS